MNEGSRMAAMSVDMVTLDARYIQPPLSGIGKFTINLLQGIEQYPLQERITVLVNKTTPIPHDLQESEKFNFLQVPEYPWSPVQQWRLGMRLGRMGARVLHSPDVFSPLVGRFRHVVTVHDLIPIVQRKMLKRSLKARLGPAWTAWVRIQCLRADAITTVSRHSAADLQSLLHVPKQKIHVVYNSIPHVEQTLPDSTGPSAKERRILYVGRRDPYKNISLLVRAFAIVRQRVPNVRLYIVGACDPRYVEAEQEVERQNLAESVVFTGHLDDSQLHAMYGSASLFAFPSLYEGFGMPPLEAMQQGVPVVSSNRSCLPEVLGNAAILVDPNDERAFAEAMHRVLTNSGLANDLRARGVAQTQRYTVTEQARQMVELWQSLIG